MLRNRVGASGELKLTLDVHDGEIDLISVEGNKDPEPGYTMNDVEWFKHLWGGAGEDTLELEEPLEDGWYKVSGRIHYEYINSIDYGGEYEEGFQIESIEKIPIQLPPDMEFIETGEETIEDGRPDIILKADGEKWTIEVLGGTWEIKRQ